MSGKAQLVSILAVIPTLKDDPSEAVRSLLRQTLRPTRIIVVSGSTSEFASARRSTLPSRAKTLRSTTTYSSSTLT
ncbi:MAG: glycosyltransferase [Thermofilum sp.]